MKKKIFLLKVHLRKLHKEGSPFFTFSVLKKSERKKKIIAEDFHSRNELCK